MYNDLTKNISFTKYNFWLIISISDINLYKI